MKHKTTSFISVLILALIGVCFYFYNQKGTKTMTSEKTVAETWENLKKTDPEFAALFNNFAFDEVKNRSGLDKKTKLMVVIASSMAVQSVSEFKMMVQTGLENGVTPVEIKEIVYQAVPYLGIGKVYDFLNASNEVLQSNGITLPLEGQSNTTPETRFDKGLALQKSIFGDRIEKMRQSAPADLKHIQDYLSANCFGDYYTRNGLDIKTRELLTFSMLVSLGGADNQVKGHIQGNLNVGNDRQVLIETLTQLVPFIGYPRTLNGIAAVNEITAKETNMKKAQIDTIFNQGEINPYGKFFTGQTYLQRLSAYDDVWHSSVANVTFEPGARTNWHRHSGGQILLVLGGEGRYQERGKEIRILKKGDVVRIPVDVDHWHGAAPNSWFTHISIETNGENNKTDWLEPVTDEEYK